MSKEKHLQKYFGVPLEDILSRENSIVPNLLQKIANFLLKNGIDTEGIFRINGSSRNVDKLRSQFEKKGDADLEGLNDPHSMASLMKMFLRELPDTLIPSSTTHLFVSVQQASVKDTKTKLTSSLKELIQTLPQANRNTLKYLVSFLVLASKHSLHSKMTPSAISTVFGPNVFKCGAGFSGLKEQGETNCVMLQMINKYDEIFITKAWHLSPHNPLFTLDYLVKEELCEESPKDDIKAFKNGFGDSVFNVDLKDSNDSFSTPKKNRISYIDGPSFSEIVQKQIDMVINKYLHFNDNQNEITHSLETYFNVAKGFSERSPKRNKKSLSSGCLNANNNINNININSNNNNNNINNNNAKVKSALSFDNVKTDAFKSKKSEQPFSLSEEEEEEEDGGGGSSAGFGNVSTSCGEEDGEEEDEESIKTILASASHVKLRKNEDNKAKKDDISSDKSSGSSKGRTTTMSYVYNNEGEVILKAKALNRSIQSNTQKLQKLENTYEDDKGKKNRNDDHTIKSLKKMIHQARNHLQELGKEWDKGGSLQQISSIRETYIILMERLTHKRISASRPDDISRMTSRQLMDEKVAVQKALLRLEEIHGRPETAESKVVVLPLYERYRLIKRTLAQNQANGREEEEAKEDYKILVEELNKARALKRNLQNSLQDFEQSFVAKFGRKIQKSDQMAKEKDYRKYKNIKNRIRFLEGLIAKKQ